MRVAFMPSSSRSPNVVPRTASSCGLHLGAGSWAFSQKWPSGSTIGAAKAPTADGSAPAEPDAAAPAPDATPREATPPTSGRLIVAIAEAIASVRRISPPGSADKGATGAKGSESQATNSAIRKSSSRFREVASVKLGQQSTTAEPSSRGRGPIAVSEAPGASGHDRGTLGTMRDAGVLLQLLSEGPLQVSFTELSERSGLSPSTAHRLLRSLVLAGLGPQGQTTARPTPRPPVLPPSQSLPARPPGPPAPRP